MEKRRSLGVTIIGVLFIFGSLLNIIVAIYSSIFIHPLLISVITIWAGLNLIIGIGIIKLKPQARIMAIYLIAISTISGVTKSVRDIITIFGKTVISNESKMLMSVVGPLLIIIMLAISIGFIYYLTRPKVKEQFK